MQTFKPTILDQDKGLLPKIYLKSDRIMLVEVLKILSEKSGRKITSDREFKNDFISICIKELSVADTMDAICALWSTYWERSSRGYVLRKFIHGASNLMPKDPAQLDQMVALDQFMQEFNKAPDRLKQTLNFSEGINPSAKFNQLPISMRFLVEDVMKCQAKISSSTYTKDLSNNLSGSKVGFRLKPDSNNKFTQMEMMIFNEGGSFSSISVTNLVETSRIQNEAMKSPDCYMSTKNQRQEDQDVPRLRESDKRLSALVSLNLPTVHFYRAWMDVAKQTPDLGFVCYSNISKDERGKARFKFDKLPLREAADLIAIQAKMSLCWELRKTGMMVLRVRYIEDQVAWGPRHITIPTD